MGLLTSVSNAVGRELGLRSLIQYVLDIHMSSIQFPTPEKFSGWIIENFKLYQVFIQ